jgi:hypothetical protein
MCHHAFDVSSFDAGDFTSATTGRGEPGVTTARLPTLAANDATKGGRGDVVGHATCR